MKTEPSKCQAMQCLVGSEEAQHLFFGQILHISEVLWEFNMLAQDQPFPRDGNTWKRRHNQYQT